MRNENGMDKVQEMRRGGELAGIHEEPPQTDEEFFTEKAKEAERLVKERSKLKTKGQK